jgi:hypothetical protein
MTDPLNKEEGVVDSTEEELDNWFEETDEEDQAASGQPDEEENSSSDTDGNNDPATKVQTEDAAQAASKDGNSASTPAEDDPYKWVNELDPTVREQAERLVQRDRSQRGRVAALQSRLDKLTAEQEAAARLASTPAAPKAVGKDTKIEDMDDAELKEFLEEYPTLAKNVEKIIDQRVARERDDLLKEVTPLKQRALSDEISHNREALRREAHQIFNTAETGLELEDVLQSPVFGDWLSKQAKGYQTYARKATSVDDAAKVLTDFAQWADQQVYSQWLAEQEAQGGAGAGKAPNSDPTADNVKARRNAALSGSAPKSRSAELNKTQDVGDYEAFFNEAVASG